MGETPVSTIIEAAQYTGTVTWNPPVSGTFSASTIYTATITLTAKPGYTLAGVAANFFTVAGASFPAINAAGSGVVTAVFPITGVTTPDPVTTTAIPGVTIPVRGITFVSRNIDAAEYSGTVMWNPPVMEGDTFAASTTYTATIYLRAKSGYTLAGVAPNFFTVEGASPVTFEASQNVVTAVFPATTAAPEAKIGSTEYSTLSAAINAAKPAGETKDNPTMITILKDIPAPADGYSIATGRHIQLVAASGNAAITAPAGGFALFTVNPGATLALGDGNTAKTLTLDGNNAGAETARRGVNLYGTLVMNEGAIITRFNSSDDGGGVYVNSGVFFMAGGIISNNTAAGKGGGVYIQRDGFTMSGGLIYGSNHPTLKNLAAEGNALYAEDDNDAQYGGAYLGIYGGDITAADGVADETLPP